jgi:hypothetical protein
MIVDLNEKELFSLMVLVHMDFLDKRDNKHVDVTFEERLEMKLVRALLEETGHCPQKSLTVNGQRLCVCLRNIANRKSKLTTGEKEPYGNNQNGV